MAADDDERDDGRPESVWRDPPEPDPEKVARCLNATITAGVCRIDELLLRRICNAWAEDWRAALIYPAHPIPPTDFAVPLIAAAESTRAFPGAAVPDEVLNSERSALYGKRSAEGVETEAGFTECHQSTVTQQGVRHVATVHAPDSRRALLVLHRPAPDGFSASSGLCRNAEWERCDLDPVSVWVFYDAQRRWAGTRVSWDRTLKRRDDDTPEKVVRMPRPDPKRPTWPAPANAGGAPD